MNGDKDVFLGRCFAKSKLLINENGKFVDRTNEMIDEPLPGFITSISAADYDNDGLLDLYLSTHLVIGTGGKTEEKAAKFMPKDHAEKLVSYYKSIAPSDMWLKRPGPPNRLLKNLGNGKFAKSDAIVDIWSNTFQATWADFDEDGDVDLYLCNDFSPDYLFRNDGKQGFVDVTESRWWKHHAWLWHGSNLGRLQQRWPPGFVHLKYVQQGGQTDPGPTPQI